MTPNEYRAKKKRCRTCIYAGEYFCGWKCEAKNEYHNGTLHYTRRQGMGCKLYKPRPMQEADNGCI